jgi:penicillin-binding protein 2
MRAILEKMRALFLGAATLTAMSLCVVSLMKIQIVDGEDYNERVVNTRIVVQTISPARGEIIDFNGVEIVSNKVGYNVIIEAAFFPADQQERNRVVGGITAILAADGVEWIDSLPITKTRPYEFLPERESDIAKLRKNIVVQPYATADDCIDAMLAKFEIVGYSPDEARTIAGVRHEMLLRDFSVRNPYTFAEDIPMGTVVKLKEASYAFEGMDVIEAPSRYYAMSDAAPHIIGTTGHIDPDKFAELKEAGYALNDIIGRDGVEKAMEEQLRGVKGERTLELLKGMVVSDSVTADAVPGNTLRLTIDVNYQRKVQQILDNHIYWLQNQTHYSAKGQNAKGGALVVLDAKTGALLAGATSPTYDLNEYLTDYAKVANSENAPLYNRVTHGLYRPGSTFKPVTATAGLNEGIITPSSTVRCAGVYTYWPDWIPPPKCTGWHGSINVTAAVDKSCNVFFYEVGRLLGADRIAEYASYYGLGESTGIEISESVGSIATPDTFAARRLEWQAGLVIQAALGQSETYVTPLQMAVQSLTIANRGVRLKPFVVAGVYGYNREETISLTEPVVMSTITDETGNAFDSIIRGMKQAAGFSLAYPSERDYWTRYLLSALPEAAAIKTGTPQMTSATDTGSAFIGFYPADDPAIAIAGFIEHGEYARLMMRSVIDAYYDANHYVPDIREPVSEDGGDITEFLAGIEE